MAEIVKAASAGTLESSDAYVEIQPGNGSIQLQVESVVEAQFGQAIRAAVEDELRRGGISSAILRISDRGALDCVIRARVEAAILRGKGE